VFERTLGLDRKKGFDEIDRAKRKRILQALGDRVAKGKSRR